MITAIYKSSRKADTYLYVEKRDDFSKVPEPLLKTFGQPIFVMLINLAKRDSLAFADINRVKNELGDNGFYLQLPPKSESLLAELQRQNGVSSSD